MGVLQVQEPKLSWSIFNLLNSHLSPASVPDLIFFDYKLLDVVTKNKNRTATKTPSVSQTPNAEHSTDNTSDLQQRYAAVTCLLLVLTSVVLSALVCACPLSYGPRSSYSCFHGESCHSGQAESAFSVHGHSFGSEYTIFYSFWSKTCILHWQSSQF